MGLKRRIKQYLQYSGIGGINALVDIGSLNILLLAWPTEDKQLLILYNTIAYTLSIINSYIWNSRITFRHHATFTIRQKIYFIIQAIVSLLISNGVFIAAIDLLKVIPFAIPNYLIQNISKGLAMFLSSTASFFFMKYFVFRKKKKTSN